MARPSNSGGNRPGKRSGGRQFGRIEDEDARELVRESSWHPRPPRAAERMGDLVNRLIAQRGIAAQQASAEWTTAWQTAVGEKLAKHTRLGNLKRGVLDVVVENSIVMQELTFRKRELVDKLRQITETTQVTSLRFRVGKID